MENPSHIVLTANQAVANIAYRINDIIPIYPITPASEMSELVEQWSANQQDNIFGNVPRVIEMQGESGVAGTMHGALQTGSLSTTFTASQGLLLMMPNMYKIAGELAANVIHVATRSVATHALSVFGDHSDIMAVRNTGYAFFGSGSVQEAMDFALISQMASLASRIPFVHFFDGFRTSHETLKIENITDHTIKLLIDEDKVTAHKMRTLDSNRPVLRGTSQGPDVYFQSREAVNPYYDACPQIVQEQMDRFAQITGRQYKLFDYVGHPEAEHVIIAMASATETIEQTIRHLNSKGEKLGLIKVRLFRPFGIEFFLQSIPTTCKSIAVLDRTKEPGSSGEPLYMDVVHALSRDKRFKTMPKIVGGRYGLSSKEFNPAMVKAIVDNLKQPGPKNNFTVGIDDDITQLSLPLDEFRMDKEFHEALFYTTKTIHTQNQFQNTLKLIGDNTDNFVQGYMECDYKKSNSRSVANLRISESPIKAPYLINQADFVACEDVSFLKKDNVLENIKLFGTLLVQTASDQDDLWNLIPTEQKQLINKKNIELYTISQDGPDETHGIKGEAISWIQGCYLAFQDVEIEKNDFSIIKNRMRRVDTSNWVESDTDMTVFDQEFDETLLGKLLANKGNELPVSAFSVDGTFLTNTSKYNVQKDTAELPEWNPELCTQCGACSMACPSGALRIKAYDNEVASGAPSGFKSTSPIIAFEDLDLINYAIQVNPDQCTSCNNCVDICPAKALMMTNKRSKIEEEKKNWRFFENIPEVVRTKIDVTQVSQQQLQEPLFKYPMGEEGCGEAPYLKLLSQLFGDRMLIANATGASSIFGGALPTTPWSKNEEGRGPAWSNSLFEDNAEFGLGFRLSLDQQRIQAMNLLKSMENELDRNLVHEILNARQSSEALLNQQRIRIERLKNLLKKLNNAKANSLLKITDSLVDKSVWIVGGDGWAYDIGYGGLDHVLASGENVNILVLDNEAYSNTGGQMSKSTPYGASAKFAAKGKQKQKKDLGLMAMNYDGVYVASVAMGADQEQTLKAFLEAERHQGPSLIIAYCHSAAHGIDTKRPSQYHKAAVASGQWLLYRNDPLRVLEGTNSLQIDSDAPSIPIESYLRMEKRFNKMFGNEPEVLDEMIQSAQEFVDRRYARYKLMASSVSYEMSMV